jgi:hypothetical protein
MLWLRAEDSTRLTWKHARPDHQVVGHPDLVQLRSRIL